MEGTLVLVIGGGATGTGIFRDLAMRGVKTILVEQNDLAFGTSSRFHGLLHSGGRYVTNDPESAKECIQENIILKKIARTCIDDTGGLFVQLPGDDPEFAEEWTVGCARAGIAAEEIPIREALRLEPNLNPQLTRAFMVPDASVDGFRLVWANVESGERYGGKAYTYHRVDRIFLENGAVTGVEITDLKKHETRRINCQYIISATGAWAGRIAQMAGCRLEVLANKGTLLAFNRRLTNRVVNRLRKPSDGDIIVPHDLVSILGTTGVPVDGPDYLQTTDEEVTKLLQIGHEMIPSLYDYRIIRTFAGVRPLYQESTEGTCGIGNGRAVARQFALIDHGKDGVHGLISIVGGKLTTYRLMAEKTVDLICAKIGNATPCRTAVEEMVLMASKSQMEQLHHYFSKPASHKAANRLGGVQVDKLLEILKRDPWKKQTICECEQVSLAEVELRATERENQTLNDIRTRTRIGMGTCQGTVCTARAVGQLYESGLLDLDQVKYLLIDFLEERWKGNQFVMWGDQLREAMLTRNIYLNMFNISEGVEEYEL